MERLFTEGELIGKLMMLAHNMEACGREEDRRVCAEAAGLIISLPASLTRWTTMPHPSLNAGDN